MDVAFRKLELRMPLGPEEKAAFASVFRHVRVYQRDQDLLSEGETPAFCGVLLEGLLCRHRTLDSGGRQILSFPYGRRRVRPEQLPARNSRPYRQRDLTMPCGHGAA